MLSEGSDYRLADEQKKIIFDIETKLEGIKALNRQLSEVQQTMGKIISARDAYDKNSKDYTDKIAAAERDLIRLKQIELSLQKQIADQQSLFAKNQDKINQETAKQNKAVADSNAEALKKRQDDFAKFLTAREEADRKSELKITKEYEARERVMEHGKSMILPFAAWETVHILHLLVRPIT